jgi:glycine cleavage system regulatory protein
MQIPLVMTIIARDRPGLVDLVARTIAEHGGNWLESRMSHLGGQFAGILRVQAPADQESALKKALQALETQGLTIVVQEDVEPPAVKGACSGAWLEIMGQDRPGIMRQISSALASFGVNVEELHSECSSAPMSGETLFSARIKVWIPPEIPVAGLRGALDRVASDLMVDVAFVEL